MNAWMSWLAVAGLVVILELFTGTFYLLMISVGLVAGALAAWFNVGTSFQMIVAAVVGAVATLALHKTKLGGRERKDVSRDPNVNMDIGQTIKVEHWKDQGNGKYTARAMYRGAMWDVDLQHSAAFSGVFIIEEVQGSRLMVRPS
ncbi:MAG: NfeD family protein [Undibacterium sp.]|nr:NfeD family protein [Undibacterium sp.]